MFPPFNLVEWLAGPWSWRRQVRRVNGAGQNEVDDPAGGSCDDPSRGMPWGMFDKPPPAIRDLHSVYGNCEAEFQNARSG